MMQVCLQKKQHNPLSNKRNASDEEQRQCNFPELLLFNFLQQIFSQVTTDPCRDDQKRYVNELASIKIVTIDVNN